MAGHLATALAPGVCCFSLACLCSRTKPAKPWAHGPGSQHWRGRVGAGLSPPLPPRCLLPRRLTGGRKAQGSTDTSRAKGQGSGWQAATGPARQRALKTLGGSACCDPRKLAQRQLTPTLTPGSLARAWPVRVGVLCPNSRTPMQF